VASPTSDGSLEQLRQRPINAHLVRGFGPLVVGLILFILMVLLAPTVAPERIVEEPVNGTTTTVLDIEADIQP
jgi:poly-D-alanine transfer protein DltD